MFCSACGMKVEESAKFCFSCGKPTVVEDPAHSEKETSAGHQEETKVDAPVVGEIGNQREQFSIKAKAPIPPGAIFVFGVFLTPLLSGILASINYSRLGYQKIKLWGILSSIFGIILFGILVSSLSLPRVVTIILSFLLCGLISLQQKKLIENHVEGIQKDPKALRRTLKVFSIGSLIVSIALIVGSIVNELNKPAEIVFGSASNQGNIQKKSKTFKDIDPIYMGFSNGKAIGSSSIKFILTNNSKNEEMVTSFNITIDPTWEGVNYQLKNPGSLDYLSPGASYTLRVFANDKELAEGPFYLDQ